MHSAPPFPSITPSEFAPLRVVSFVDRDHAAGLLRNFLAALDADDAAQRDVFMQYARAQAERHLASWGVSK